MDSIEALNKKVDGAHQAENGFNDESRDLMETFYCDYNTPAIQKLAGVIAENTENSLEIAEKSFLFVRDRIPFGFDLYKRKASETLSSGFGSCWNKALLLTALLRCNKIPANFGSIPMKRTFFSPVIGTMNFLMNNPFNHCATHALVNSRWIILDSVLDPKTYNSFFKPAGVKWGIDWNKKDDCRLYTESVLGPMEIHNDIDDAIAKKAGNTELPEFLASFMNRLLNKKIWKKAAIQII